jgi:hypothetical protein
MDRDSSCTFRLKERYTASQKDALRHAYCQYAGRQVGRLEGKQASKDSIDWSMAR